MYRHLWKVRVNNSKFAKSWSDLLKSNEHVVQQIRQILKMFSLVGGHVFTPHQNLAYLQRCISWQ